MLPSNTPDYWRTLRENALSNKLNVFSMCLSSLTDLIVSLYYHAEHVNTDDMDTEYVSMMRLVDDAICALEADDDAYYQAMSSSLARYDKGK